MIRIFMAISPPKLLVVQVSLHLKEQETSVWQLLPLIIVMQADPLPGGPV